MVKFFFNQRGCEWLPGNQVKKQIIDKIYEDGIELFQDVKCSMDCQGLTESDIEEVLGRGGDVIFPESQRDTVPKEYIISGKRDTIEYKFGFLLRPDTSGLVTFAKRTDKKYKCDCF